MTEWPFSKVALKRLRIMGHFTSFNSWTSQTETSDRLKMCVLESQLRGLQNRRRDQSPKMNLCLHKRVCIAAVIQKAWYTFLRSRGGVSCQCSQLSNTKGSPKKGCCQGEKGCKIFGSPNLKKVSPILSMMMEQALGFSGGASPILCVSCDIVFLFPQIVKKGKKNM